MGDDLDELSLEDIYEVEYRSKPDDEPSSETARGNDEDAPLRSLNNLRRVGLDLNDKMKGLSIASSARWASNGRQYSLSRPIPHPQIAHSASDSGPVRQIVQSSAPVNVPNWGKILGSRDKLEFSRAQPAEDEEDGDDEREPPHIRVQKQLKKENDGLAISFSVCEGKGRTLKGRDQGRVKTLVLQKTGFLDTKPEDGDGLE